MPSVSANAFSMPARPSPGLRACTSESRHSSVAMQQARAVHVDGAALQHHLALAQKHAMLLDAQRLRHASRHRVVALVVRVLGPAVEPPVGGDALAAPCWSRRWRPSRASRPGRWECDGSPPRPRSTPTFLSTAAGLALERGAAHEDAHALMAREQPHQLAVGPGDGREASRPVLLFVRPADPGGGVGDPLRGHRVAAACRRGAHGFSRCRCVIPA